MRISYSLLDSYQTCPLKYKFREIDKIKEPKSKEAVFGTLIHAVLKYIHTPALLSPTLEQALDYYSKGWNSEVYDNELEERSAFSQGVTIIQNYLAKNKPSDFAIVDLESHFSLEIGNEEDGIHTVSGVIDRIDKTPEGYEIIDYKTTRKMPSQDKVDNDLQLSIYLRAFLERYPKEKEHLDTITVSLYFVKHGVKLSSKRTKEQLDQVENIFLDVIQSIEAKKFDPLLSPLCDWCGYQNICPMWKHKFTETQTVADEEAKKAIAEYLDLKEKMNEGKQRLGKLQALLLQYMEEKGVERVFDPNGIVAKSIRKTYKYDADQLRSLLEPLDKWESVLKVDGTALKNILSTLPISLKQSVEQAKVLDKESTSLSVKKNKIEIDEELSL